MKKIFLCFTALLLLFAACEKTCIGKKPKNVKPIDWENYNDVFTVYWNYISSYSKRNQADEGKTIKISGWRIWSRDAFTLGDDAKCAENFFVPSPLESVSIDFYYCPEVRIVLDTSDLTKKCYVTGVLSFFEIEKSCGVIVKPEIIVYNANDIYFK